MEAIHEGEWSSINGIMCSEEAEFMAQLLGNCSLPNEDVSPAFWPAHDAAVDEAMYSSDSFCSFSQGSGFSGGFLLPFSSQESSYPTHASNNNNLMTMDYCTNNLMGGVRDDVDKLVIVKREGNVISPSQFKKRSRVPCEVIPRSKKSMKCSMCPKQVDESEEDNNNNNAMVQQTSSSCCGSEDEAMGTTSCWSSKAGRAPNPNGRKTRADRGSTTYPQSLYARKRRERINERLRILQTLVPNGTKVDISTMLEEAVQYVKFLQLQIKLLSSDDMWMYAPIAYNGMDIGLDLRQQSS